MIEKDNKNKTLDLRSDENKEQEQQNSQKNEHRREFEERIERIAQEQRKKEEAIQEEVSEEENVEKPEREEKDKPEPILDLSGGNDNLSRLNKEKSEDKEKAKSERHKEAQQEEILEDKLGSSDKKKKKESQIDKNRNIRKISSVFTDTFSLIPNDLKSFNFPPDFLWGASTSAYQVEGGIKNNWSEWEESEKRKKALNKKFLKNHQKEKEENFFCGKAVNSYERWEEDLDLAKEMNLGAIRMGIEWSRIQPEKETWDVSALDHYREVLEGAQKRGLKTVVTLWHWTNPLWLTAEGGFENKEVVKYFKEYTKMIVSELGGLVDFWVTLNEPMLAANYGYFLGIFPPQKRSFLKFKKVSKHLIKAHIGAYEVIHEYFPQAKVSITNLSNVFEPMRSWFLPEVLMAKIAHYYGVEKFFKKIKNHIDYIGVDYYRRIYITMFPPFMKTDGMFLTDMGWEIYPEGIYDLLKVFSKYKKPIYILENGLADENDMYRAQFIKEHLYWIWKAMEEGVDVRGYFHWSLLDNFEWDKGFEPKFGLYGVDRKTFERKKRKSGEVYGEICKTNRVNF